jgi:arsenate reductase (glutaredoxin)
MSIQVYGIPNCGTCKKALQWLDFSDIEYEFIDTKECRPTRSQIAAWVEALGNKSLRNTSGQSYRSLGAEKQDWNDEQWVCAFAQDAMLLKRPLFVKDGVAVLAGFRDQGEVIRSRLGV